MSDTSSPGSTGGTGSNGSAPRSPEVAALEADLEQTRERLAGTIDALGDKLDVKGRAQDKAVAVKDEHGTQIAVSAGIVLALVVSYVVWRRTR